MSEFQKYCRTNTAESLVDIGHDDKPWPQTMDANLWADEFCKRNSASDHGTILGWFANSIMLGYDTAQWEREENKRLKSDLEDADIAMCQARDERDICERALSDKDAEIERLTSAPPKFHYTMPETQAVRLLQVQIEEKDAEIKFLNKRLDEAGAELGFYRKAALNTEKGQ